MLDKDCPVPEPFSAAIGSILFLTLLFFLTLIGRFIFAPLMPAMSIELGLSYSQAGSYDIYFGPKAPAGKEANWIQTIPGKSWFIILRAYGPLAPWIDKTWRPGEIELVK